jgi:hypothetical protein
LCSYRTFTDFRANVLMLPGQTDYHPQGLDTYKPEGSLDADVDIGTVVEKGWGSRNHGERQEELGVLPPLMSHLAWSSEESKMYEF